MNPILKHISLLLPAALAMLAAACNKDDVIVPPEAGGDSDGRPATGTSSAFCNRVYEWLPGPGQFINEPAAGELADMDAACEWALARLKDGQYVSLGAFGGYITVGFDHSIMAGAAGYDFAIGGNAFLNASSGSGGSNEPGIVYVMQDSNGNGLPDDTWYELRGSESGTADCLHDYAVTYMRPAGAAQPVEWTDNLGGTGTVDHLAAFHNQPSYYPAWVKADSYTLSGTRLKDRTTQDPATGLWDNSAFGFGYADNRGSDVLDVATGMANGFCIANAMLPDGSPAGLSHIDFVKVQTGVNSKAGWLGEVSTEVLYIKDLRLAEP